MHASFHSLIGQEKAKTLLRRSFAAGKMSHAYLFRGPDGVGKKRAALTFAAYVNCLAPAGQDACGNCTACVKFKSGNHPDLTVIEPDGAAIKIGQVRDLKHRLTFPPFEARHRVVVLTDTHTMRREAANSLLKTLEEPPPDTILILTADQAVSVLPTIVSRCQVIPFFALPYERVAQVLAETEEGIDAESAATLAAVAEGSLGRAALLLRKKLLPFRREIVESLLRLPAKHPDTVETVFALAETAAQFKEHLPKLLDLLRIWVRDLMLQAAGAPEAQMNSRDLLDTFPTAAKRWTTEQLAEKLKRIETAERRLLRNCNRALVCEVLFFSLF